MFALCEVLCRHLVNQMSFNLYLRIIPIVQIKKLTLGRVSNLPKVTAIKSRRKIQTHIYLMPIPGLFLPHHVASVLLPQKSQGTFLFHPRLVQVHRPFPVTNFILTKTSLGPQPTRPGQGTWCLVLVSALGTVLL